MNKEASATQKLAMSLLTKAVEKKTSDLHIKPFMQGSEVRFRIDGLLQRVTQLPGAVAERLIRYFKANAEDMEPTISHVPQDGRMSLSIGEQDFDLRISVLPAKGGENLVIRFLEQGKSYSLTQTGMSTAAIQLIRQLLTSPSGMIVMTGPTGSGKSTTLYAMLNELNRVDKNITSIEDPVEYRLQGTTQVSVNEKAGLTFPAVIKACLRQDPDILLIGEIRDELTARTAVQAAITGHLVLTTLHTNDAITTVSRLEDLGVTPVLLSEALVGVIAQRLVRRLCNGCRVQVDTEKLNVEETAFKKLTRIYPAFRAGEGCDSCDNTGYSGRVPITEFFVPEQDVSQFMTVENGNREQLQASNKTKLNSLSGSAARMVVSGETSISEAARVLGKKFWDGIALEYGSKPLSVIPVSEANQTSQHTILLISSDEKLINALSHEASLHRYGFLHSETAEKASDLLHKHDETFYVIVDLKDVSDEENVQWIHQARQSLSWSYLPALLLLPADHNELEAKLIDHGAISDMLQKPVTAQAIIQKIRKYSLD